MFRLIEASGFHVDTLLNDGLSRVALLTEYDARFTARTEDQMARQNIEIERMTRKIEALNEMCRQRQELHMRQMDEIAKEAQRLQGILSFLAEKE
jgi:hypothetical protein